MTAPLGGEGHGEREVGRRGVPGRPSGSRATQRGNSLSARTGGQTQASRDACPSSTGRDSRHSTHPSPPEAYYVRLSGIRPPNARVGSHAPRVREVPDALLSEIRVVNFRSARRLALRPGPVCAFIGEPGAGKSNLLFALRALLDPGFDLSTADVTVGQRAISIEATLADGRTVSLDDRDVGSADRALPDGAARRRARLGDGGLRVRGRSARVDPRGAGAGSRAARRARARARGLRGRDLGRRLRDRGAGAVPRPAGAPLSPPADPTARRVRQSGLLHHARSGPAQRRCARGGQSRRPRRARRDDGRAAGRDRRRRHVPRHVRVRRGALRALLLARGDPGRGDDREDRPSSACSTRSATTPIASRSRSSSAAASRTCRSSSRSAGGPVSPASSCTTATCARAASRRRPS